MKKHSGNLIYSSKDAFGSLEVIDIQQRIRSLHFGNGTSQSAMFLYSPIPLIHKYTQALLTPLCGIQAKRILILGMGAGSIAKFLEHHFKEIKVDVVELRAAVINIAKEYFSLPNESENFIIHNISAQDFIQQNNNQYDLIIVDLFLTTTKKTDTTIDIASSYTKLSHMLSTQGFLSINLIGSDYQRYSGYESLCEIYQHNLYYIDIEKQNTILIAGRHTLEKNIDFDFSRHEKKHQLPWRHYFNTLNKI